MATGNIRQQIRYSDFKVNLDVHPIRKDLVRLTNTDSVKRSLLNLIITSPYERFFNPDIGVGLRDYLFENVDTLTAHAIKQKIIEVTERYEPRAEILQVDVSLIPSSHNLEVTIVFSTLNSPDPQTLSVILERVR